MKRLFALIAIALTAVIAVTSTSSIAATLPDSLRMETRPQVQGKIAEADSLKSIAEREKLWNEAVLHLCTDQSVAWAVDHRISDEKKQRRLNWLTKRWGMNQPDSKKTIKDQVATIQAELASRAKSRAKLREQITGTVNKTVPGLVENYLASHGLNEGNFANLERENYALSSAVAALSARLNAMESHGIIVDSTLASHADRLTDLEARVGNIEPDLDKAFDFISRVKLNKNEVKATREKIEYERQ